MSHAVFRTHAEKSLMWHTAQLDVLCGICQPSIPLLVWHTYGRGVSMLALSNRPVEEGWAGFGRIKGPGVRCPPMKHGSQCLRAIISLGEAWLDTERAELVGWVAEAGKMELLPLCSGSGRRPYATFQGPVWSWCEVLEQQSKAYWGILALDGRAIADFTFRWKV